MDDFFAMTLAVRVVTIGSIRKTQTGKSKISQVNFLFYHIKMKLFQRTSHHQSGLILLKISSTMVTPYRAIQNFSENKTKRTRFSNKAY